MGASLKAAPSGGGGRRRRGGGRGAPMSEINVTPFVDVMLVLLIVFMVAAPLLTVGVPVQLPKTAAAPMESARQDPITINVDASGAVFLQGEPVSREDLPTQLMAVVEERGDQERIFLRADQGVPYGDVMTVMGELNARGLRNIGLVTDPGSATAAAPRPAGGSAAAPAAAEATP
ncbi:protein TolR [Neomegalonema perideroedes]|uniref:protein TolR n=1 Tax=Neomegalonema perideroedes TaxID=217219 RepID=UPI00035FDAB9|nr:protein TolR [Neomegalonema perideroedes]